MQLKNYGKRTYTFGPELVLAPGQALELPEGRAKILALRYSEDLRIIDHKVLAPLPEYDGRDDDKDEREQKRGKNKRRR